MVWGKLLEILEKTHTSETNINPTILYNEGWMLRLLFSFSFEERISVGFPLTKYWYSEALLSSPFLSRGNKLGEGHTHADLVFGDFTVETIKKRVAKPIERAKVFGVIEAKMNSLFSKGTKNASYYDQPSRIATCIAFTTLDFPNCDSYFILVAPQERISELKRKMNHKHILACVERRFEAYRDQDEKIYTLKNKILNKIKNIKILSITYEDWINAFPDGFIKKNLLQFYNLCLTFNGLRSYN